MPEKPSFFYYIFTVKSTPGKTPKLSRYTSHDDQAFWRITFPVKGFAG
jgi:hypothetical protein